jgi:hypothetical protein
MHIWMLPSEKVKTTYFYFSLVPRFHLGMQFGRLCLPFLEQQAVLLTEKNGIQAPSFQDGFSPKVYTIIDHYE